MLIGKTLSRVEAAGLVAIVLGSLVTLDAVSNPSVVGLVYIGLAEVFECTRVVMSQVLLQDTKMEVWQSLSYVAPVAATLLSLGSVPTLPLPLPPTAPDERAPAGVFRGG